jgi:hypothetical protein
MESRYLRLPVGKFMVELKAALWALFFILPVGLSHADAAPPNVQHDRGVGFYIDQDLFVPFENEDRDYTMGLALEFFWEKKYGIYPLDGLTGRIGRWIGLGRRDDNIITSFIIGTVNYTPNDLSQATPIFSDRPYASLIYLGNKRVRASKNSAVAAEALIGVIGTNVAREFQQGLHKWWRDMTDSATPVDPKGWGNQISDGGELTLRLRFSNSRLQYEIPGSMDIATTWSLSLGYQTNLSVGISGRMGNLSSSFWSIPFDPVNRGNFLPSIAADELYVWSAYRVRAIGYDAMLQGQFRDSVVTFDYADIEKFVHEGAVGITYGRGPAQVTFAVNAKSAELKNAQRRKHIWGSLNFIYQF